jgi:hypothetical protein
MGCVGMPGSVKIAADDPRASVFACAYSAADALAWLWPVSGLSLACLWPVSGLSLACLWPVSGLSSAGCASSDRHFRSSQAWIGAMALSPANRVVRRHVGKGLSNELHCAVGVAAQRDTTQA